MELFKKFVTLQRDRYIARFKTVASNPFLLIHLGKCCNLLRNS